MKKLISVIVFCLFFQTCVFANDNSNTYEFCKKTVEDGYGYIETELKTFNFENNSLSCEVFYYGNALYVPIREISELIGKTVQYNSDEHKVTISDDSPDSKSSHFSNADSFAPSVKKFDINKIPVVYHYNTMGTYIYGANGLAGKFFPTGFSSEGKIYICIMDIMDFFKCYYYEENGHIYIEKIPDNLKLFSIDLTPGNYEMLEEDNPIIDDSLIEKALLIEYSKYSGRYNVVGQEVKKCLYSGKPCIHVITDTEVWFSGISRPYHVMYEVTQ